MSFVTMPPDEESRRTPTVVGSNGHARRESDVAPAVPRMAAVLAGDSSSDNIVQLWEQQLQYTDEGLAVSTGNIELILANYPDWRGKLRYNKRTNQVVLEPGAPIADSDVARAFKDVDDARLAIWFERSKYRMRVSPSSASLAGAVNVVASCHGFDPVHDWLDALQWDGKERIDRFVVDYLGAGDTPIHRAYGRLWLISAVARVFAPGCQVDHTLGLYGAQGIGKSSALRCIAVNPDWFTDTLPSLADRKAAAEVLHGRWIVEHGELDALGRAELSTAKAWLTSREDRYRAAYAKRADSHPRRCVFAATTNEPQFLRDASGGRRFWPVSVGKIDLAALERDRDQLWAEAVHRYRAGEPWHLIDRALIVAAAETQEERYQVDAWEPLIADYLELEALTQASVALRAGEKKPEPVRVTIQDLLAGALNLKPERWDQIAQNRVARCLQHLGWVRRLRRDGEADGGDADGTDSKPQRRRWAYERGGDA